LAVDNPALCSFRIPIICFSENFRRFIVRLLKIGEWTLTQNCGNLGEQVMSNLKRAEAYYGRVQIVLMETKKDQTEKHREVALAVPQIRSLI